MKILSVLLMGLLLWAAPGFAQYSDDRFDPGANNTVRTLAIQADGKIVVGGDFTTLRSESRNRIGRINADGRLDYDFFNAGGADTSVCCLAIQADGKIIVGGVFTNLAGQARSRIGRLESWGSLDTSFNPEANGEVFALAIQEDGKILVGGDFSQLGGESRYHIGRLNTNGAPDMAFGNPAANGEVRAIAVQSDGKILVGGAFGRIAGQDHACIARLTSAGSLDTSFSMHARADNDVYSLAIQADGKIIVGGKFTQVSYQARNHIARLNTDGSLDTSFNPNADGDVYGLAIQADGKIVVAGDFTAIGGGGRTNIARLNLDGTIDAAFNATADANALVRAVAVQSDGKILAGGDFTELGGRNRSHIGLFYPDGITDQDFWGYADDRVYSMMPQTNWTVVIGGAFDMLGDYTCYRISKVANGNTFNGTFCHEGANNPVISLILQPDGKTVAGGDFTQLGGDERGHIGRINGDGLLDRSFYPRVDGVSIYAMALQADGKILVGGSFTALVGRACSSLGRLNSDGSLDASFNPACNGSVYSLALQADGKIIVGGLFSTLGAGVRNNIGRLNSDGTLDSTFNPGANSNVYCIVVQPDGKILAGGAFTELGGQAHNRLARLNSAGALDEMFNPNVNGNVFTLALQADGKIIVGGSFSSIGENIGRLYSGGYLDTFFGIQASADSFVCSLAIQPDGKILVGGNFDNLAGYARSRFGRLSNNDAALQNLSVNDTGSIITWTRGGASPEVWRVTFEQSTNSTIWTSLGAGTWNTNGWQLAGLSLATNRNVYIRARGYGVGGIYAGSSFFHESVRLAWITSPAVDITNVTGSVTTDYDVVRYTLSGSAYGEVVGNTMWWTNSHVCGGTLEAACTWSITNITLRSGTNTISVYGTNNEGLVVSDSVNIINRRSIPLAADFDGDRLADPVVYAGTNWYVWLSYFDYLKLGPLYPRGIEGATPVVADFDGDGIMDFAVYSVADWYTWCSSASYARRGPYHYGIAGAIPLAANFDNDHLADPTVVDGENWYIWFSVLGYNLLGALDFGVSGMPVAADYDGDGLTDLAAYASPFWYIRFSSMGYAPGRTEDYDIPGAVPVAGDFDGDRLADPALVYEGLWYIWLSSLNYARQGPYAFNLSP